MLKTYIWRKVYKPFCPVCNHQNISFLPLPEFYRDNAQKYGYKYFGKVEMTALDSYSCSKCGAADRERLYAYYIDSLLQSGELSKGNNIVHFAPEGSLRNRIESLRFKKYLTVDLSMEDVDVAANIEELPFPDNTFDFFICSHVLEHVCNDELAIDQLYRVLKPGGGGILMVPIAVGLDRTVENKDAETDGDRWRYHGQNDHLRLYAHDDYVSKVEKSGFMLKQLGIDFFGKKIFRRMGLKDSSILYVVVK